MPRHVDAGQDRKVIRPRHQIIDRPGDDDVQVQHHHALALGNPERALPLWIEQAEAREASRYLGQAMIDDRNLLYRLLVLPGPIGHTHEPVWERQVPRHPASKTLDI